MNYKEREQMIDMYDGIINHASEAKRLFLRSEVKDCMEKANVPYLKLQTETDYDDSFFLTFDDCNVGFDKVKCVDCNDGSKMLSFHVNDGGEYCSDDEWWDEDQFEHDDFEYLYEQIMWPDDEDLPKDSWK